MTYQVTNEHYSDEVSLSQPSSKYVKWKTVASVVVVASVLSVLNKTIPKRTSTTVVLTDHISHNSLSPVPTPTLCQAITSGNVDHSIHPAARNSSYPVVDMRYIVFEVSEKFTSKKPIRVYQQVIHNPLDSLSVVEPRRPGTCLESVGNRSTVRETAENNNCIVAMNGGFFNVFTGECYGNIVTDGVLVKNSRGIRNAHFGLTEEGNIVTGYLSEQDVLRYNFTQLIGGVIWLVRDGTSYVKESMQLECPYTQETGTMDYFAGTVSGRVALGHDAHGAVHLIEVNGRTHKWGVSLYDFAQVLIELGIVNAINLDGGGSMTVLSNGTLVNLPSDQCPENMYICEREVSTVLCVHEPRCAITERSRKKDIEDRLKGQPSL